MFRFPVYVNHAQAIRSGCRVSAVRVANNRDREPILTAPSATTWIAYPKARPIRLEEFRQRTGMTGLFKGYDCVFMPETLIVTSVYDLSGMSSPWIITEGRIDAGSVHVIVELNVTHVGMLPDFHAVHASMAAMDERLAGQSWWEGGPVVEPVAPKFKTDRGDKPLQEGTTLVGQIEGASDSVALRLESKIGGAIWQAKLFWIGQEPDLSYPRMIFRQFLSSTLPGQPEQNFVVTLGTVWSASMSPQ